MKHSLAALLLSLPVPQAQPSIVVFVLDDVGAADLAAVSTPNIDALAACGVTYTRAYAHAWCAPTRDSIHRSAWDGIFRGDMCAPLHADALDPGVASLSKLLDAQGYRTYMVGKDHLGLEPNIPWPSSPLVRGWNHWRAGAASSTQVQNCDPSAPNPMRVDDGLVSTDTTHRTIQQRDATIAAYWEAQALGEPALIQVGFSDAHAPWVIPPASILPPGYVAPPAPTDRDRYVAEILALDVVIGEIVSALPADVWYVILGDNGTPVEVDVDTLRGSKLSTYEGGVRVPLILAGPGMPVRVVDDPVHVVDLAPTIAEALDLPIPPWVQGVSLSPTFAGLPAARPWVFVWNRGQDDRSVIEARWKLRRLAGVDELFDLFLDPDESAPLPPVGPDYDRLAGIMAGLP